MNPSVWSTRMSRSSCSPSHRSAAGRSPTNRLINAVQHTAVAATQSGTAGSRNSASVSASTPEVSPENIVLTRWNRRPIHRSGCPAGNVSSAAVSSRSPVTASPASQAAVPAAIARSPSASVRGGRVSGASRRSCSPRPRWGSSEKASAARTPSRPASSHRPAAASHAMASCRLATSRRSNRVDSADLTRCRAWISSAWATIHRACASWASSTPAAVRWPSPTWRTVSSSR